MLTEPWTLLLIFLGGLAGSGHCLGMCGGFALTLGLTPGDLARRTTRQVIYGLGRTFTYVALGVVVGAGARRLEFSLPSLSQLQGWLGLVAGVLLVWQALATFGWRVWPRQFEPGCLLPGMFGELMRSARGTHVFLGGMVNGLLPCGLVWSYL
ncbi:MAG TPA: sulfite exporter TauE/SafE family protein, partial [Gemmatales bacterium]|nr:sulfite exporter TauE/SafE family protein [Gemmatales bacterium]